MIHHYYTVEQDKSRVCDPYYFSSAPDDVNDTIIWSGGYVESTSQIPALG